MKINARLLVLTFTIVVLITVSSSIVYYSVTNKIITSQQNQSLLNSTNDFIFNFQIDVENVDDAYKKLLNSDNEIKGSLASGSELDFLFTLINDSQIDFSNFYGSENVNIRTKNLSLVQFLKDNPNIILKYDVRDNNTYYYGKIITKKMLNAISEKIRADIALVINDTPFEVTKSESNQVYFPAIFDAIKTLQYKNQFDIYSNSYDTFDFFATFYTPTSLLTKDIKISFVIFNSPKEVLEFRYNTSLIAIIITIAGIALALILVLLFTTRLRVQISNLSYAAEIIGSGNLEHRVPVNSKDELGKLGLAFNKMLDQLKTQKEAEEEYTEFITLLNQKPSLDEISDAAIQKIIKATGISFGVIYLVQSVDHLKKIAAYGISKGISEGDNNFDYYKNAIEQKDVIEFTFKKNLPIVKTGLTEIRIKYSIIVPILYGDDVVAIIELASKEVPDKDVKAYLLNIREQLAIGIINGSSFEKLKHLVEDLKKLNVEYENQNKELRELHQQLKVKADELNVERIKALESTKLKSQFLTNITHELKTPLNSIIGLSDLINKDDSLEKSHKNRLNVIIRNGKKLLNLINNILEFSRAEAGKTVVKNETFTLSHFIDEINSYIQPYALEKGLNYVCETPEDTSVLMHTDRGKLEQILINLLSNAIKFTDEGVIRLTVTLESENSIKFDVEDTGIGIDKEDQSIVFEEFRQADGTISRQYDGTGLGLSICKRFAELLNGEFHLNSEVGKGSKFTVIFREVILQQSSSQNVSNISETSNPNKVLILDENKTNKKLIADYLKLNDYTVVKEYNSAEDLIEFVKEKDVSKIIINQDYNGNRGWDIIKRLIDDKSLQDVVPIIIATQNEKNYGYGLSIYNYITGNSCETKCSSIISELSNRFSKPKLNILYSTDIEPLKQKLEKDFSAQSTNIAKLTKLHFESEGEVLPDVVFIDINKPSLEVIDKIKHNRQTRSIQFIGIISENFDNNKKKIVDSLSQSVVTRKHHVIDVLKILRDRFQISENEISKAKLLIDDEPESEKKERKENSGELKVLIVDDDRDTLFTVGEIVKSSGYHPLFAKNGVECILTLKHNIPDLILLDIMMPKMDGFETLKEIRKSREYDKIPVVALTAYAMIDDKDIISKSGFNDIITKPIDTKALTSKIGELFKRK